MLCVKAFPVITKITLIKFILTFFNVIYTRINKKVLRFLSKYIIYDIIIINFVKKIIFILIVTSVLIVLRFTKKYHLQQSE